MNKTILQVPLSKELKITAENVAISQGFSSLQEAVRLFLNKLAQGNLQITFEETTQLSTKAINRYNTMLKDIEKGTDIYEAKNIDELMKQLHNAS
jgi:antitoxin component of RelBE/YafQ-DinJ toxin-antitoxin module